MRTNLTPAGIRAAIRGAAASKRRVELNDPATPGLNLRIAPSGRATWTWMGRDADGRVRRFGLGHIPTISIAEARRKARKLAEEVRGGADPVRDARIRRKGAKSRAHCNTLSTLLGPLRSSARREHQVLGRSDGTADQARVPLAPRNYAG